MLQQHCISKLHCQSGIWLLEEESWTTWHCFDSDLACRCACGTLDWRLDLTALLLETVQDKLENVQDKLENIQYKMEQQQGKTNRLLDGLATIQNVTMDGM